MLIDMPGLILSDFYSEFPFWANRTFWFFQTCECNGIDPACEQDKGRIVFLPFIGWVWENF